MSRTLKRVPLDFKWPIDQVWKGFLNPYHSQACKTCDGSGLNPETKKISDDWYSFDKAKWIWCDDKHERRYNDLAWCNHITQDEVDALVAEKRLHDFTHKWNGEKWVEKDPPYRPTAEEVNRWNTHGFGHDGINHWICVQTRANRLGVYGKCEFCHGEGQIWHSEKIKKLSEEWEPIEPPAGEGFQLWETVSEGSPQTPVFKTLDELCEYAAENCSTFADNYTTAESWKNMLEEDNVRHEVQIPGGPTMVFL